MDSNKLYITTDSGEEKEMEILFTFDSEQYGKSYVLFVDPQDPSGEVFAMSYDEEGNLEAVESETEWDMISEVFEAFNNDQEE